MDFKVEHEEDEDFGHITFRLGPDDTAQVMLDGSSGSELKLSLYNHEAQELIELLRPIADAPEV